MLELALFFSRRKWRLPSRSHSYGRHYGHSSYSHDHVAFGGVVIVIAIVIAVIGIIAIYTLKSAVAEADRKAEERDREQFLS